MKSIMLCAAVFLGSTIAAWADARDEVQAAEQRCASTADKRLWLDCYYGAAQPLRQELGLSPAPPEQTRLVPPPGAAPLRPVAQAPDKKQGWIQSMFGSTRSADATVMSRMESYSFDKAGLFTVSLANGQVWQQLVDDKIRAHWHSPAVQYDVQVGMDAGGGFALAVQNADSRDFYKVRRLR
jgi:hypothetical protein